MEYRVEQLAAACGVSVDTVRYYQTRGLLPPPRREGRVALYGREHVERVRRIRALQRKGLTLAVIARALGGRLGRGDADLAEAVASAQTEDEEVLTLPELAARSGVPATLLRQIQREGIPLGRVVDGEERFTTADLRAVRSGIEILEAGLPLTELLALAKRYHAAARAAAERAVELFDEHVREPIRASGLSDREAADRLVDAFRRLLPAVTGLVAHHFRRVLLQVAEEHIERVGDPSEIAASREEARRMRESAWPG